MISITEAIVNGDWKKRHSRRGIVFQNDVACDTTLGFYHANLCRIITRMERREEEEEKREEGKREEERKEKVKKLGENGKKRNRLWDESRIEREE